VLACCFFHFIKQKHNSMKKAKQHGSVINRKEMKKITGGLVEQSDCVGAGPNTYYLQCPNQGPRICCSGVLGPVYGGESGSGIACLQPIGLASGIGIYVGINCPGTPASTLEP
jgi:hypothetical protein